MLHMQEPETQTDPKKMIKRNFRGRAERRATPQRPLPFFKHFFNHQYINLLYICCCVYTLYCTTRCSDEVSSLQPVWFIYSPQWPDASSLCECTHTALWWSAWRGVTCYSSFSVLWCCPNTWATNFPNNGGWSRPWTGRACRRCSDASLSLAALGQRRWKAILNLISPSWSKYLSREELLWARQWWCHPQRASSTCSQYKHAVKESQKWVDQEAKAIWLRKSVEYWTGLCSADSCSSGILTRVNGESTLLHFSTCLVPLGIHWVFFFLRIAEVPESRGAKDQCGQSVFIHLLLTSVFAPDGLSTIFWEFVWTFPTLPVVWFLFFPSCLTIPARWSPQHRSLHQRCRYKPFLGQRTHLVVQI